MIKVTGIRDGRRVEINSKPLTIEDAKELIEDIKRSGLFSNVILGESEPKRSIKELEVLHPSEMSLKDFLRLKAAKGQFNGSESEKRSFTRLWESHKGDKF